ncbi:hypothetical protein [Rhizohabitans arisaemae]|uniref:hypothetical protein n=1 Tax=Rhizohabitans arisaemae TaxID=2720610 RepID=UPI0024B20D3B|nr:hypothetical protein [Rhizohabitans arisaemae]
MLIPTTLDALVDGRAKISVGAVFTVSGFKFTPNPEWQVDLSRSYSGRQSVLIDGAATYRIYGLRGVRSVVEAYREAVRRFEATTPGVVSGDPRSFVTSGGLAGLSGMIVGVSVSGRLSVVFTGNRALVTVLTVPPRPACSRLLEQADQMTFSVRTAAK